MSKNKIAVGTQGVDTANNGINELLIKEQENMTGSELMHLARLRRQEENSNHMLGLKKEINVNNIYITKDNPKSYFKPQYLIDDLLSLPQSYEEDYITFFDAITRNEKLERRNTYKFEVRDTQFKAFDLTYGPYNFRESFRLVLIRDMDRFLKAVKSNSFTFNLSYDELIIKAHELIAK